MTPLELLANLFNLLSVLLATLNRTSTWPMAIGGGVLYGIFAQGEGAVSVRPAGPAR